MNELNPDRRRFAALLSLGALSPAWAREGIEVGETSKFAKFVPAERIEQAASMQYAQMVNQANGQHALLPRDHPQVQRLRYIAKRILPFTEQWNPRARQWRWEVNILNSKTLNAFCMPGGKIAFFYGILAQLQLSDDEVAAIMGHEVAHALREHARERMGKEIARQGAIGIGAALLGLGHTATTVADLGSKIVGLSWSREDETEADLVGMELAARAGYDPSAGISLWEKMGRVNKGAPPQWLSTHPAGRTRIRDIQAAIPQVAGLYAKASKPEQRFEPARYS